MKKLIFLLMALLPAVTWAAVGDEFAIDGLKYKVTSEGPKTVELTRFDKERPKGALAIPATVNGYAVTSIGTYAFKGCDGITSVEIPNSVTSIGTYAFCYCYGLTSVTIGNGVTTIKEAFIRCPGLTTVTIPASVTRIDNFAFASCADLTTVNIAKNSKLKSVGRDAFFRCEKLPPIEFPAGVERQ